MHAYFMGDTDEADKVANQALTERYLKRFNGFVEDHSTQLIQILENYASAGLKSNGAKEPGMKETKEKLKLELNGSSMLSSYGVSHNIWGFTSDPLEITWGPLLIDALSYEELITCSNSPVDSNPDVQKVMLVLCSITSQIKEWREEGWKNFFSQLVLYGDGFEDERGSKTSVTEGKGHTSMSKFLPFLYDLDEFTHNCVLLITNCVQQLGSLFKDSKPHVVSISGLNFPTVFLELANLLVLLVVLDEVIANQSCLQEHWTKYRRMIKSVRADSTTFSVDSSELLMLEKDLATLDQNIFSGNLFRSVMERVTAEVGKGLVKSNTLIEKITSTLIIWSDNLEKDFLEGVDELKPLATAALFIFTCHLFPNFDGKRVFQKNIWEHLKKIPAVPIGGSHLWVPETFFNSFSIGSSKFLDQKNLQTLANNRHAFLQQKVSNLPKEVLNSHIQIAAWSLKLQETFYSKDMSQLRLDDLSRRSTLLTQGVKFSQNLSQSFRLIINLHATLGRPVTKQTVSLLCQILGLLKTVQSLFHRFNVQICESASSIVQNVMHIALSNVNSLQVHFANLRDPKRVDDTKSDTIAVLSILGNVLRASPTKKRLLVSKIAFEWVTASYRLWREEDNKGILAVAIERIIQMVEIQETIKETCNGSPLYWHRVILSAYFSSVYCNEMEAFKLPVMFLVLNDCLEMIEKKSPHGEDAIKNFIQEVEECFKINLVEKLCRDVETDLRLMSHSHLNVAASAGEATSQSHVKDYNYLLDIPSVVFNGNKINLKFVTEHYLTKTFYNLASVALHDWQSYATMRVLASDKYNLNVLEDHLPGHTLEQGLDILDIVRNISKFVTEFSYNLNNQVFVQVNSPNKHLDTVNIRHLANSLRAHGPGLTNTTVNFTYLFLRAKIHTFSQFLYDEQIKSRLSREIRLFKQGRLGGRHEGMDLPTGFSTSSPSDPHSKQEQSFPYDRVVKFQRGIRKLGLTTDGLSPLDQFRILITHIGNALGFVRLVRSGQLHFLAAGCRFVPDLDDVPNFDGMTEESLNSDLVSPTILKEIKIGSQNVDAALKNLSAAVDGVDYLRLLANGFSGPCRNQANIHMKNFYVIIPALTLSYVDHMRSCKERLLKKASSSAIFTDDGFPMGVAYLLNVLGQDREFDSLQWFSGVTQRLTDEREAALHAIQESKKDEKLQQANTLTAKRIQDNLQEFQLLRYNLSSARIFFQQRQLS